MTETTRRARKTEATKGRILEATDMLLRERGYEAVTFRNLAERSGVSFGSIQHHFRSKDHLLFCYGSDRFAGLLEGHEPSLEGCLLRYAAFCEEMGKDFMRLASANGQDILRAVCFEQAICPAVESPKAAERVVLFCRSTMLLWASSGAYGAFPGELEEALTHAARRALA